MGHLLEVLGCLANVSPQQQTIRQMLGNLGRLAAHLLGHVESPLLGEVSVPQNLF